MKRSQYDFWIESEGDGFFGTPTFPDDYSPPKNFGDDPSLHCAYALDRAKKSDFSFVPGVLDLYGKTGRPIVDSMVLGILAYAGPASCIARIAEIVKTQDPSDASLELCGVMAERSELSYVPIFLELYSENIDTEKSEYFLDYIEDILGDATTAIDPSLYEDELPKIYNAIAEDVGSEAAVVFQGRPFSVARLARYVLGRANRPHFRSDFRRSFEAATGIDCRSWYEEGRFRPLAASAVLEEFLESPDSRRYEEGVRYFFGHRIPD